jgi:hypothetical protein
MSQHPATALRALIWALLVGSLLGFQSPGGAGKLRLGVGPGQAGRLRGLLWRSHHPGPSRGEREPVEGPREGFQEVKGMAQRQAFCPEGEEVKKLDNITKTKRRKIPPRELRIKAFNDVRKLRKRGLSYTEIRKEIYRKYGVWIPLSTMRRWLRGVSTPYNGRRIPSLELLKPSEDLAYVIGMLLGDGSVWEARRAYEDYRISLKAKDKEFVEESAIHVARVLRCRPPKVYFDARTGYCQVGITSPLPILTRLCTIATAVAISSMLFRVFELTLL